MRVEFSRIPLRSVKLAISFSLLLPPLPFSLLPLSFPLPSSSPFVSSERAVVGDRLSGWFSGLLLGIITLDTKIADSPNHHGAFYRERTSTRGHGNLLDNVLSYSLVRS